MLSFFNVAAGRGLLHRGFGEPLFVVIGAWLPAIPNAGLWAAFACTLFAFGFRLWGASYLGRGVVLTRDTVKSSLAIAGPYRFTRNPLYFGNVLLAMGIGSFGSWLVLVTATLGMILFSYALISVEERDLRATFGERFAQYANSVPRLFPTPLPKLPDLGTVKPSLVNGLRTELFVSAPYPVLTAAFAITGKIDGMEMLVAFGTVYVAGAVLRATTNARA